MKILLTSILVFAFQIGFGQSGFINSPMAIGNAGETWIQSNYNISFTVGEIAVETYTQNQTIFTQNSHEVEDSILYIHHYCFEPFVNQFPYLWHPK